MPRCGRFENAGAVSSSLRAVPVGRAFKRGLAMAAVFAALAIPAPGSAATAGCPGAPVLTATTYDAAVAELRAKRSPLVPRRETVQSTRTRGSILEPPKPSLEQGVCYLTFKVSDGSLARIAVKPGTTVVKPGTGTSDGPALPSAPDQSSKDVGTGTTAPAPPPSTRQSSRVDSSRQEALKRILEAITGALPPQQGDSEQTPNVDDRRSPPAPAASRACPPLPAFSEQTVEAALQALRQQRNIRPNPQFRASPLPRGALLAPPTQQRGPDGLCHVTLLASDGSLVRVPRIVGMDRELGQSTVLQARLRFESTEAPWTSATPGSVVQQDPAAGVVVPIGTVVRITIARNDVAVPSVVGLQNDLARRRLSVFRVEQTTIESVRPAGEVVDQTPRAGERRPPGTPVRISASDGSLVQVPAVTGLDAAAARARLEGGGLTSSSTAREDAAAPSTVVDQQPVAGAIVKRGSRIAIAVSEGLTVPRVVDLQLDAAGATLARFQVEAVPTESEAARGRVIDQSPAPGTRVAAGARVTLRVSDASLVAVPDVRNRTLAQARAALSDAELVARVTDGADESSSQVMEQQPVPGSVVRRRSEISLAVRAPFPWSIVMGAVAVTMLLLCGAVGYRLYMRGKARAPEKQQPPPLPPINVVAAVEFQAAPPQPDEVERTGPDIRVDARVDVEAAEVEMETRVHA